MIFAIFTWKWSTNQNNEGMSKKETRGQSVRNYTEKATAYRKKMGENYNFCLKRDTKKNESRQEKKKKPSELTLNTVQKNTNRLAEKHKKKIMSGMRRRRKRETEK